VRDSLICLGTRDDVYDLMAASDVLLLTSRSEGLPNAVLEAMHLGVPVVCSDVGDISCVVEDGIDGFLFERQDAATAAERVTRLLTSEALRGQMAERAREKIGRQYHPATMVSSTLEVLHAARRR
jgi:glycosyltransferase involved in cell wall biosynthesis